MKIYTLKKEQFVPTDIDTCWDFFSQPKNLQTITPPYMGFKILHGAAERMYPGQIIEYKVSPVLNIPMQWVTEIKHVVDNKLFVDNQMIGPYKLWHHKHFFEVKENGVLMTDIVHYALPFGILGQIAHALFVKKQLQTIFDYREQKVIELFGK
jgi:ligand-binding SRPBCC domain-containing protein